MFGRTLAIGGTALLSLIAATGCSTKVATASAAPQSADSTAATPASAQTAMSTTPCATRDVRLRPGTDNGDLNGAGHSGASLILTNRSRYSCSIPGLPQLTFLDANRPVQTTADLPGAKLMHPGPVVLPLVLQPKQSITTSARWVSGPVFQDNLCYKLTGVTLALRNGTAMTALTGQMCGERSKGVHYDLQRYGSRAEQ